MPETTSSAANILTLVNSTIDLPTMPEVLLKLNEIMADPETAPVEEKFKPLLAVVKILTLAPHTMTEQDAAEVFAAGWDE